MKTRCPECQTVFRVTPEQLKARAGKVRCGHCQKVFNALDSLLESPPPPPPPTDPARVSPAIAAEPDITPAAEAPAVTTVDSESGLTQPVEPATAAASDVEAPADGFRMVEPTLSSSVDLTDNLILPRDTTEIPGYSRWAEGAVTSTRFEPESRRPHWLFSLAALLLVLGLAGQAAFHFRSEVAISFPAAAPLLERFSAVLGSKLPLPRHTDLVSIETSDLQTDAARGNLLVLNATLRNRAPYAQDYPSLELSLTDTQDVAIARRVFSPLDYLPPKLAAEKAFPANADIPIRLWIEARELSPAGYRLYVFYP